MLHERSNINTSLAEQLKFQGKWTFIYSLWVNSGKLKKKKKKKNLESGHFKFRKCYIKSAPQTKEYRSFLRELPKLSKKQILSISFK